MLSSACTAKAPRLKDFLISARAAEGLSFPVAPKSGDEGGLWNRRGYHRESPKPRSASQFGQIRDPWKLTKTLLEVRCEERSVQVLLNYGRRLAGMPRNYLEAMKWAKVYVGHSRNDTACVGRLQPEEKTISVKFGLESCGTTREGQIRNGSTILYGAQVL